MFAHKLAGLVVAGLMSGAGAVNAADTAFPSSVSEVASSWYSSEHQRSANDAIAGAAQPVFPSAGSEFGAERSYDVTQRPRALERVMGGAGPVFPTSASEV